MALTDLVGYGIGFQGTPKDVTKDFYKGYEIGQKQDALEERKRAAKREAEDKANAEWQDNITIDYEKWDRTLVPTVKTIMAETMTKANELRQKNPATFASQIPNLKFELQGKLADLYTASDTNKRIRNELMETKKKRSLLKPEADFYKFLNESDYTKIRGQELSDEFGITGLNGNTYMASYAPPSDKTIGDVITPWHEKNRSVIAVAKKFGAEYDVLHTKPEDFRNKVLSEFNSDPSLFKRALIDYSENNPEVSKLVKAGDVESIKKAQDIIIDNEYKKLTPKDSRRPEKAVTTINNFPEQKPEHRTFWQNMAEKGEDAVAVDMNDATSFNDFISKASKKMGGSVKDIRDGEVSLNLPAQFLGKTTVIQRGEIALADGQGGTDKPGTSRPFLDKTVPVVPKGATVRFGIQNEDGTYKFVNEKNFNTLTPEERQLVKPVLKVRMEVITFDRYKLFPQDIKNKLLETGYNPDDKDTYAQLPNNIVKYVDLSNTDQTTLLNFFDNPSLTLTTTSKTNKSDKTPDSVPKVNSTNKTTASSGGVKLAGNVR